MILKNKLYFWIDPLRCQIPRNMYTSSSIYIYIYQTFHKDPDKIQSGDKRANPPVPPQQFRLGS